MQYSYHKKDIILLAEIFRFVDVFFCTSFAIAATTNTSIIAVSSVMAFVMFLLVLNYMRKKNYFKKLNIKGTTKTVAEGNTNYYWAIKEIQHEKI